ncbi:hypothetical protein RU639_005023 [Aspergillus parasiticus]
MAGINPSARLAVHFHSFNMPPCSPFSTRVMARTWSLGILVSAPRKYFLRSTYRHFSKPMTPFQGLNQAISPDLLYLQKNDGAVVAAQEEDFYRYTTKRWLSNDTQEASQRYQKFNIQELLAVAAQSIGNDATRCTHVMKYPEGLYNKAFLLTFSNGSEVVAKLPNPNAGPRTLTTTSEVATMEYVSSAIARQIPELIWEGASNSGSSCSRGARLEF